MYVALRLVSVKLDWKCFCLLCRDWTGCTSNLSLVILILIVSFESLGLDLDDKYTVMELFACTQLRRS